MAYYLGTDEAGYGPNLGPLVVSATVWQVPDELDGNRLYDLLAPTVVSAPREASADRMAMADSKRLYNSGKSLRHLERGLLAALRTIGRPVTGWDDAWSALDGDSFSARNTLPWYADYRCDLPQSIDSGEIDTLADALQATFVRSGVRLIALRSRAVFPAEFNTLCRRYDSKGLALSNITLALTAAMTAELDDQPIRILCDKHGGRNRYADLLADHFPEWLVEIHGESNERSTYRLGPSSRRIEIAFATKAESYVPAALASMASKYLRELSMKAFNTFWTSHQENLRPTAGYPVDAKRFKAEIAELQQSLNIPDETLWRER